MRGLIDDVVVLRLEEEVPGLAAGHGHQPADHRGQRRILERHRIRAQEAHGADEVKRLVDPAMVVVAVVVPALFFESLGEVVHLFSLVSL
jgi:hypothetical protein